MAANIQIAVFLALAIFPFPCTAQEVALQRIPAEIEYDGCGMGCVFKGESLQSGKMIFSSDLTIQSDKAVHGKVLIEDKIVDVKRTKNKWTKQKKKQGLSVGDTFIQTWKGKNLELIFECEVTNPGYDGESFSGSLTVIYKNRQITLQIQGYQGC